MFLRNMKNIFSPPAGSPGVVLFFFSLAYLCFGPVPVGCLCTVCISLLLIFPCLLDSMKVLIILAF